MSRIEEAFSQGGGTQLNAALLAGIDNISYGQEIEFVPYVRIILPLDGYAFWVKASMVSPSALFNTSVYNSAGNNKAKTAIDPAPVKAKGSFHYATEVKQEETETSPNNLVIFTAEHEIQALNTVGADFMYIGIFDGLRFAFSKRENYYKQADIHHYIGHSVYSTLASQIIEDPTLLNVDQLIVSNSLPIWLAMNNFSKEIFDIFGFPPIRLWPSYLAHHSLVPPFGTVHIDPASTRAISMMPYMDPSLGHTQLLQETVRINFYGLNNDAITNFMDFVNQYSIDYGYIGMMNSPVPKDAKKTQAEFNILAQQKYLEYEVNYYQIVSRQIGRQLIKEAFITYIIGDLVIRPPS